MNFEDYLTQNFYDELVTANGKGRNQKIFDFFNTLSINELKNRQRQLEASMVNMGITFSLYAEESGLERIIPVDIIPRVIEAKEWKLLERGLKQRVFALNEFLKDIYSKQLILKDNVIPAEIVFSSEGFLKNCMQVKPAKDIYIHITGTDLVRSEYGEFLVLEDNLRCPSGVSYMLQNRELSKQGLGDLLGSVNIRSINAYCDKLLEALSFLSDKDQPTVAVLTPGIYNSAYYEHSFLALQMGVELVDYRDLIVHDGLLKMRTTRGPKTIDVLYRRLDDTFIDPLQFNSSSLIGIPGVFHPYQQQKLAVANALGTGVADDKVIYAYVPKMIKYYCGEEPILQNVTTYLCSKRDDLNFVLENLENLVIKEAHEAGGKGMLIGPKSTKKEREHFKAKIKADPRNFIAQETISLSTSPCVVNDSIEPRRVDLRPYILYGKDIHVTPGGLTRVALKEGSLVVNSSQGGGSKDTWVLTED